MASLYGISYVNLFTSIKNLLHECIISLALSFFKYIFIEYAAPAYSLGFSFVLIVFREFK